MQPRVLFILAVAAAIISVFYFLPFRNPFATLGTGIDNITSAPYDRINESSIRISSSQIILSIENAIIGRFANTSSMVPVINENSTGIEIAPSHPEQVHKGDIITFEQGSVLVVHRVIETGEDSRGWYAITKGDNSASPDGKIRFEQISSILIGILY
ncbi:MAG: hypothetical protein V1886_01930 [archaeon]